MNLQLFMDFFVPWIWFKKKMVLLLQSYLSNIFFVVLEVLKFTYIRALIKLFQYSDISYNLCSA